MKMFVSLVLVVCFSMFIIPAFAYEDLPEPGMDPNYEPEDVQVDDTGIIEDEAIATEAVTSEEADLEDDEYVEDADSNDFESEIGVIEEDQEEISDDDSDDEY